MGSKKVNLFLVAPTTVPIHLTDLLVVHANCGNGVTEVEIGPEGFELPSLKCSGCGYSIALRHPENLRRTAISKEPVDEQFFSHSGELEILRFEPMPEELFEVTAITLKLVKAEHCLAELEKEVGGAIRELSETRSTVRSAQIAGIRIKLEVALKRLRRRRR